MSSSSIITVANTAATPWRNGGGVTRELLTWPDSHDWQVRISVADIASDGAFSAFPGVQRWFTLLSGQGVVLDFANALLTLHPGDAPLAFDGATAPGCRLIAGPVRDLNLMLRGGTGGMVALSPATAWCPPVGARAGMFTRNAGLWSNHTEQFLLPAVSLLWFNKPPPGDWRFETGHTASRSPEPAGWWLYHCPQSDPS